METNFLYGLRVGTGPMEHHILYVVRVGTGPMEHRYSARC